MEKRDWRNAILEFTQELKLQTGKIKFADGFMTEICPPPKVPPDFSSRASRSEDRHFWGRIYLPDVVGG